MRRSNIQFVHRRLSSHTPVARLRFVVSAGWSNVLVACRPLAVRFPVAAGMLPSVARQRHSPRRIQLFPPSSRGV